MQELSKKKYPKAATWCTFHPIIQYSTLSVLCSGFVLGDAVNYAINLPHYVLPNRILSPKSILCRSGWTVCGLPWLLILIFAFHILVFLMQLRNYGHNYKAICHLYSMIIHRIRHWNKGSLGSFVQFIWIIHNQISISSTVMWPLFLYLHLSSWYALFFIFFFSFPSRLFSIFISAFFVSPLSYFLYLFLFPPSSFFFFLTLFHLLCSFFSFCILHGITFLSLLSWLPFPKFSFSFSSHTRLDYRRITVW